MDAGDGSTDAVSLDLLLGTVGARGLLQSPSGRAGAVGQREESDLYGLAQRVAVLTGGLVSIEDEQARLLAYSATDGAADELRMLSILGREGPPTHLRRLRELGVYDRLRTSSGVVEVGADEAFGWRRRLVISIQPFAPTTSSPVPSVPLGAVWVQEGDRPLAPDARVVLEGAAAIAARLIHRARSAPTQEALQIQRLLGIRGDGVDVPTLASALAIPAGPAAVVGIAGAGAALDPAPVELASALRLLAAAYVRESLVSHTDERLYVLIPRVLPARLEGWVGSTLERLTARFGIELRAAVAAPVAELGEIPAARAEVDRVLDRPGRGARVTTLTRSRTAVLLGEIADLVGSRPELRDPRLAALVEHDRQRDGSLVASVRAYLRHFGDVRAAAADLHVHPNTLRYRIGRAEQVLGFGFDDPESRLLLQIQLLCS